SQTSALMHGLRQQGDLPSVAHIVFDQPVRLIVKRSLAGSRPLVQPGGIEFLQRLPQCFVGCAKRVKCLLPVSVASGGTGEKLPSSSIPARKPPSRLAATFSQNAICPTISQM